MNIEQIVERIDAQIQAIAEEVSALQAARSALVGGAKARPTSRTPAVRPAATIAAGPRRTRRKGTDSVTVETVLALLSERGELSSGAIAKEVGGERVQVLARLRELERAGKVQRSGERRTTRWRAFTQDDWVAQRAAELAARG